MSIADPHKLVLVNKVLQYLSKLVSVSPFDEVNGNCVDDVDVEVNVDVASCE
jgi:hypothetical protein